VNAAFERGRRGRCDRDDMTNHAAAADRKPLNPLSIAAGFLPWIVFSLVAQRKHTPTQLNLYSLGLFGVLAVTIWFTNTYRTGHRRDDDGAEPARRGRLSPVRRCEHRVSAARTGCVDAVQ
jgi:hypothetical protein